MARTSLIQTCLDDLERSDDAGATRQIVADRRQALLGTPGVAAEVIGCLGDVTNAELDRRLALLEVLIDEARMDKENRGRFGERFLSEAHHAIDALAEADNLDEGTAVLLAHAYACANLEAPGSLGSSIPVGLEEGDGVTRLPVDPDSLLDRIRDEAEGHVYGLHGALAAGLGVLPVELRPDFVRYVAGRDDGSCGRLALYWMLDPVADIRLAAATGLLGRARRGALEPATAAPLPLIRSWMPADRARQVLDAALREAHRRDLLGPIQQPAGQPERCLGTLPDGSGSQSFAIGLGATAGPAVAMVLVKTGYGIKDAFVVSDEDGDGPNQTMTEMELEAGALDIPWETVPATLAAALAEGLASGHPPSAGLLDVALACGLTGLRPRPLTPRDWLAEVDPEGEIAALSVQKRGRLINRSETWPDDHPIVETWYEGTAIFDEMLKEDQGPRQLEAALWAHLETRREVWALTMMRAAHIMQAAGRDAQWMFFAATGAALLDGRSLKKTPIMGHVFDATIAAWQEEEYGFWEGEAPGAADVLEAAPAPWGEKGVPPDGSRPAIPSAWLDGYLMAAVLAPVVPRPGAWLSALVEKVSEFADEQALERFVSLVTARYNEINAGVAKAEFVAALLAELGSDDLATWARGFSEGVTTLQDNWPRSALAATDRRALSLLAGLAAGDRADELARAELSQFVGARFAARQ